MQTSKLNSLFSSKMLYQNIQKLIKVAASSATWKGIITASYLLKRVCFIPSDVALHIISYHIIYSLLKSIKYHKSKHEHNNIKHVREPDSKAHIETLTVTAAL